MARTSSIIGLSLPSLLSFPIFSNSIPQRRWRIGASFTMSGVDLTSLGVAIEKKDSEAVQEALDRLSEVGWAKKWSSQPYVSRRTTTLRELTTLGIKNAENLAIPSVRNDAVFLFTVEGTTGFLGVIAGQLPGAAIDVFSSFFPHYQGRIVSHEAAHFLVVSMARLAAEGLQYDKVVGESADLFTLQRFINRSKPRISKEQQQKLTRWAVLFAASLIKNNKVRHEALCQPCQRKSLCSNASRQLKVLTSM